MPDSTAGQPPAQPDSKPAPTFVASLAALTAAVQALTTAVLGADHPATAAVHPPKPVESPPVSSPGIAGTSASPPSPG